MAVDVDPSNVLKTTVFLQSMGDFAAFNQVYAEFFGETKPARSCVEVAKLPLGALVEIEWVSQLSIECWLLDSSPGFPQNEWD